MHHYEKLDIYKLILDLDNPRIKRFVERYGENPTDKQIALALGAASPEEDQSSTTFYSLRESIRTNRGIIHPIIVNKNTKGKYVVIEGNTRVSIYKEFDEAEVEGDWKTIPAIVFKNLEPCKIEAIRLQAHLVGPRQWDPYSKAKYLNYLRDCEHLTMHQIIAYCGGRQREIEQYIEAYNDMEEHYRPILDSDSDFDARKFSAFFELQKPGVKMKILEHGFTYKEFSLWVHNELIYPLNTVRQLPQILANKKTKEVFLRDGIKEAIKILDSGEDINLNKASVEAIATVLYRRLSGMPLDEFKEMKKDLSEKKVVALFSLEEELVDTCKMLRDEG